MHLHIETTMITSLVAKEVVAHEVEWKLLIPRRLDIDQLGLGFIPILQQLHFTRAVPSVIERRRRIADIFTINSNQRTCGVGIYSHTAMYAPCLQKQQQRDCYGKRTWHSDGD